VVLTDTVGPDLVQFDDPAQAISEVWDWVVNGPPCENVRGVGPDHTLSNGIRVQYFIGTHPQAYVGIVRIRPPIIRPPAG
jgi:hypothetical protein